MEEGLKERKGKFSFATIILTSYLIERGRTTKIQINGPTP